MLRYGKIIYLILISLSSLLSQAQVKRNASLAINDRELKDFLVHEMVYPEQSLKDGASGRVVLELVVFPDSSTGEFHITEGVNEEINSEAIRLAKKLVWNPAYESGRPIASKTTFEVNFNPKKYRRFCKKRGYTSLSDSNTPIDSGYRIFPYSDVEIKPKPKFSTPGMYLGQWISDNIEYPPLAQKQGIKGTVKVSFIVEEHGRVHLTFVEEAVGGGCSEEAVRLVKMLVWEPGENNGKRVRVETSLEITFNLRNTGMDYVPSHQVNSPN